MPEFSQVTKKRFANSSNLPWRLFFGDIELPQIKDTLV